MRAERIAWIDALLAGLGWGHKVCRGGALLLKDVEPSGPPERPFFGAGLTVSNDDTNHTKASEEMRA